jgi:hypothetical protein
VNRREVAVIVHDGSLGVAGSLESSDNSAAGGDVDSGNGETLLAGVGEELQHIVAYPVVNFTRSDLGERGPYRR